MMKLSTVLLAPLLLAQTPVSLTVQTQPQGSFDGLDQVNVQLPATLQGAGAVQLQLTAAGNPANPVSLTF